MLLRCYVFALLFILSYAQAENDISNFHDKPLTIAVNLATYPYQFIDEQGEPQGIMVELWRLWASKQQVEIAFIPMQWSETLEQVNNHSVDIHAGMVITDERRTLFDFTPSFFSLDGYIFVHKDLNRINGIDDLKPYIIGVTKDSSHAERIRKAYPELSIKTYPGRKEIYQAALDNEIFVFSNTDKLNKEQPQYQTLKNLFPVNKKLHFAAGDYGAAVAKGNQALLTFISQGLAKISFEEKAAIERKWLGLEKQQNTLLLAFSTNLPPFMAVSPTGKPQGLFVDLWRMWSEQTGQEISFIAEEMGIALEMVKQRQADVHIAYPESDQLKTGLLEAWQLYEVRSQIYVSSRFPAITSLADLGGKTLGIFETAPYKYEIEQAYPNIHIRYYRGIANMLQAAELEEIDAMVSSVDNMNVRLVQANLQSSFFTLNEPIYRSKIYSLVKTENPELANMIEEGFKQIPQDKLIALEKKWLPQKKDLFFSQQQNALTLTFEEQRWISEHRQVNVGYVKNWTPMEFTNKKGDFDGINYDVFHLIAQRSGINFNYVSFDNWSQLYQALVDGVVDMAGGMAPTKERKAQFIFSKAYWESPWTVLHPQHLGELRTLDNLSGKKLAVVKGYQLGVNIIADHPQILIKYVDNTQDGLLAVQQGVVDGLIEPLAIATELLKKESLTPLMVSFIDELEADKSQSQDYMVLQSDLTTLRGIIDKGIDSISDLDKQTISEKWYDVNINTGFNRSMVKRVGIQIAVLIFIIIIVIVIWNRRLTKEINQRKQLELQMKHMATHDELTGLANRVLLKDRINSLITVHQRQKLQMAVLFIDLDGFKAINDAYGHDVGDELLQQLADRFENCVRKSDTVVRFGGDEFILLLTGLHHAKEAAFIAEKVLRIMKTPLVLSKVTTCVSCSIGIAVYPDDGVTDTELVKVADTLMYKVKSQGKNNYIFS